MDRKPFKREPRSADEEKRKEELELAFSPFKVGDTIKFSNGDWFVAEGEWKIVMFQHSIIKAGVTEPISVYLFNKKMDEEDPGSGTLRVFNLDFMDFDPQLVNSSAASQPA